jgi:hypothetical protein
MSGALPIVMRSLTDVRRVGADGRGLMIGVNGSGQGSTVRVVEVIMEH